MIDRARTRKRGTAGRDVRETYGVYLGLRRCGLSTAEAGNLTARLEGIHVRSPAAGRSRTSNASSSFAG